MKPQNTTSATYIQMKTRSNKTLQRSDGFAVMRTISFIASLVGGLLLISCTRTQSGSSQTQERSVEQRVTDLEQFLNGNRPRLSEAEAQKQYERDLA